MKVSQQVENILAAVPKTRDSDRELWVVYAQKFGVDLTEAQVDKIRQMPSLETLTRCRRKLQEQGKYKASPKIAQERRIKSYMMQQNAPTATPERTGEILNQRAIPWMED